MACYLLEVVADVDYNDVGIIGVAYTTWSIMTCLITELVEYHGSKSIILL